MKNKQEKKMKPCVCVHQSDNKERKEAEKNQLSSFTCRVIEVIGVRMTSIERTNEEKSKIPAKKKGSDSKRVSGLQRKNETKKKIK